MKGPYERLKYDLRRLWECPQCHRRERTDGAVTYRFCSCQVKTDGGRPIAMRLLEEAGHRTVPPIVPKISDEPPAIAVPAEPLAEATEPAVAEPESARPPEASSGSLPPQ